MAHLLDQVSSYFSPVFVEHISQKLNEDPNAIFHSIKGMAATLLSAVIHESENPDRNQKIYDLLKTETPETLPDLETLIDTGNLAHNDPRDAGGHLITLVFGNKTQAVFNSIAAFSGAGTETVSSLSGVVGAVVVRVLGKIQSREQLTSPGFFNLLHQDHAKISSATPAQALALLNIAPPASPTAPEKEHTDQNWVTALLALVVLALAMMWMAKNC
ncbi:MAG: DUF937 domain-containing protein [Lewinellaceae bacterium]|nr:DUF937 domain-containing protein [Lewinellaceae bacterium]